LAILQIVLRTFLTTFSFVRYFEIVCFTGFVKQFFAILNLIYFYDFY